MGAVVLHQPRTTTPARRRHPSASLASDAGVKLVLPFAPVAADLGGLAPTFDSLDRPGRKPLVRRTADGLKTLSFAVTLARRDLEASVEDYLATLTRLAASGGRITLGHLSPHEAGPWRLSDVTVSTEVRQQGTNHITRATVALSFVEASDAAAKVGPVTGGHRKPRPHVKLPTRHVWRKGDTLKRLADRYYGEPGRWRLIAKANKIKHPRHIKPGRRLTIPRP